MKARLFSSIAMMFVSIGISRANDPQLPLLKEGLLESHTQMVLNKQTTDSVMKFCSTHAIDKSMKSVGERLKKQNHCMEVTTRLSANSYSSEMHCDKDGSVTKMTITFQGDTSFHMEQHTTAPQVESVMIMEQRYVGSCPADMKPGDAVMADGKRFNFGAH